MGIKILRILIILSYCCITISGEQIGGPFLLLLVFVFMGHTMDIIAGLILIASLFVFTMSTFTPRPKKDKYLTPVILLILLSPFLIGFRETYRNIHAEGYQMFIIPLGLYVMLSIVLVVYYFRKKGA